MVNIRESIRLYKLTGRIMKGTNIIGYEVADNSGRVMRLKREDIIRLAWNGEIENCIAVKCDDTIYLKGKGIRISELPIVDNTANNSKVLTLKGRILKGYDLIGYLVTDDNNNEYKVSREKVWQLARMQRICNATAQINGSRKIIRGKGIALRSLPEIIVE